MMSKTFRKPFIKENGWLKRKVYRRIVRRVNNYLLRKGIYEYRNKKEIINSCDYTEYKVYNPEYVKIERIVKQIKKSKAAPLKIEDLRFLVNKYPDRFSLIFKENTVLLIDLLIKRGIYKSIKKDGYILTFRFTYHHGKYISTNKNIKYIKQ